MSQQTIQENLFEQQILTIKQTIKENLFEQQILTIKQQQINKKLIKTNEQLKISSGLLISCGVSIGGLCIVSTIVSGGILLPVIYGCVGAMHSYSGVLSYKRSNRMLKYEKQKQIKLQNVRQQIVVKLQQ